MFSRLIMTAMVVVFSLTANAGTETFKCKSNGETFNLLVEYDFSGSEGFGSLTLVNSKDEIVYENNLKIESLNFQTRCGHVYNLSGENTDGDSFFIYERYRDYCTGISLGNNVFTKKATVDGLECM